MKKTTKLLYATLAISVLSISTILPGFAPWANATTGYYTWEDKLDDFGTANAGDCTSGQPYGAGNVSFSINPIDSNDNIYVIASCVADPYTNTARAFESFDIAHNRRFMITEQQLTAANPDLAGLSLTGMVAVNQRTDRVFVGATYFRSSVETSTALMFSPDGTYIGKVKTEQIAAAHSEYAAQLSETTFDPFAFDSNNNIYVRLQNDSGQWGIFKFSAAGDLVSMYDDASMAPAANTSCPNPEIGKNSSVIMVNPVNDNVYVSLTCPGAYTDPLGAYDYRTEIAVFDSNGAYIRTVDFIVPEFAGPLQVYASAFDKDGKLYVTAEAPLGVADVAHLEPYVAVYSLDGQYLRNFTMLPDNFPVEANFHIGDSVFGMIVDKQGRVMVPTDTIDSRPHDLLVYGNGGGLLDYMRGDTDVPKSNSSEINDNATTVGFAADSYGRLYIAGRYRADADDAGIGRVFIYYPPDMPNPPEPNPNPDDNGGEVPGAPNTGFGAALKSPWVVGGVGLLSAGLAAISLHHRKASDL